MTSRVATGELAAQIDADAFTGDFKECTQRCGVVRLKNGWIYRGNLGGSMSNPRRSRIINLNRSSERGTLQVNDMLWWNHSTSLYDILILLWWNIAESIYLAVQIG